MDRNLDLSKRLPFFLIFCSQCFKKHTFFQSWKKLLQHSKKGISKFHVEKLYRVCLVGRNFAPFAKALADFLASQLFECKACITPSSNQRDREHAERVSFYHQRPYAIKAAELLYTRNKECLGKPAYRVNSTTKSPKGAGSRNNCAEC